MSGRETEMTDMSRSATNPIPEGWSGAVGDWIVGIFTTADALEALLVMVEEHVA